MFLVVQALMVALLCCHIDAFPVSESVRKWQASVQTKILVKRWWNPMKVWDMPISFKVDEDIPDSLRGKIREVVELIHNQTKCIRFEETSLEDLPYIHYKSGAVIGTCSGESAVGKNYDTPNFITVNDRCFGIRKVEHVLLHETLHALGLQHEFARSDRDKYLRIHKEMVKEGETYNFDIREEYDTFHLPFDYASVMNYAPTGMAKFPGLITMDPVLDINYGTNYGKLQEASVRTTMSDKDVKHIRKLYMCD